MRLSEAQVLIAATARRYFEGTSRSSQIAHLRQRWSRFAEFGWLGGILSEEMGGYGGSVELSLLSQQFGAALAPEPWIEAAVIPIVFLSNIVPKPAHRDLCGRIVAVVYYACVIRKHCRVQPIVELKIALHEKIGVRRFIWYARQVRGRCSF